MPSHPTPLPPPSPSSLLQRFLTAPPELKPFLLDLNPPLIYGASHIGYSTCLPITTLQTRLHELPSPPCVLLIYCKRRHLRSACQILLRRGYTPVPLPNTASLPTVSGTASRALWQPSPLLQSFLPELLKLKLEERSVLDIACGSGRDAKFLSMHSFMVTAVDRSSKLLGNTQNLHKTNYYNPLWPYTSAEPGSITTIQRTLGMDRNSDTEFLKSHARSVLLVVRFLRRGVLELLHHGVKPGGYVLYEHFLEGCEAFGGPFKKSQMLTRGELRQVFSEGRGFTVVKDVVERLPDGRPVNRFIARRD